MEKMTTIVEQSNQNNKKNAFPGTHTGKSAAKKTIRENHTRKNHRAQGGSRSPLIYEVAYRTENMPREEWLERRNEGIGGSDIAAILNMSRYKSRRVLWMEKTGIKPQDDLSSVEAVHFGNVLEDVVAKEFSDRTGLRVRRRFAMLRRKDKPYMTANVDRLIIGRREGLECKTAHDRKADEWSTDEVPTEYFLQCQWYMAVTGFKRWHIAVLIGGNKFFYHDIERDDELIALMEREADTFWNDEVMGNQAPDWSGADDESAVLLAAHPVSDKKADPIELDPEAYAGMLDHYDKIKAELSDLEKEKRAIENQIKEQIGDGYRAEIGDRTVTWSTFEQKRIDSKRLKEEAPELFEKYAKSSVGQRFIVK